jgi:hypothetical protein
MCLASLGDPDRPSGKPSPAVEVPGGRVAAVVVAGDRAGSGHVPDDVFRQQLLDRREARAAYISRWRARNSSTTALAFDASAIQARYASSRLMASPMMSARLRLP